MDFLNEILPIIINFLLIILLIVGIILGIKAIITISKVDKIVDDVNEKVESLNGFFAVLDYATDKIGAITDHLSEGVLGFIGRFFESKPTKRRKRDLDE